MSKKGRPKVEPNNLGATFTYHHDGNPYFQLNHWNLVGLNYEIGYEDFYFAFGNFFIEKGNALKKAREDRNLHNLSHNLILLDSNDLIGNKDFHHDDM